MANQTRREHAQERRRPLILVILLMVFFANDKTFLYAGYKAVLGIFVAHPEK